MFMRSQQIRERKGFTLMELLIVVAIIGIIATMAVPNLLDALQKANQKRTISEMRNTGSAWFSWLTDNVGAASAGQAQQTLTLPGEAISATELLAMLDPRTAGGASGAAFYISDVPARDGWGNAYNYCWAGRGRLLASPFMAIASGGRDGEAGGGSSTNQSIDCGGNVTRGTFPPNDYDDDIVWMDGYFVRQPGGQEVDF